MQSHKYFISLFNSKGFPSVRSYTSFGRSRKDIAPTYLNNKVWDCTVAVTVDGFLLLLSCVFCYILNFSFPHNRLCPVVLVFHLKVFFHTNFGLRRVQKQ